MFYRRFLVIMTILVGLSGCENMNSATQTIKDLNKVLSPLVVLKKGSE
jgi:hypothetical protein